MVVQVFCGVTRKNMLWHWLFEDTSFEGSALKVFELFSCLEWFGLVCFCLFVVSY